MPLSFRALSEQEARAWWAELMRECLEPAAVFGPGWAEHPLPGERCWRMTGPGGEAIGWVSLEPHGIAEVLTNTFIRPMWQRAGLRRQFRQFYAHQAFSDPRIETVAAEILPGPYADALKRDPGAPWRIAGELWYPRPKLLIALSREDAVHAGVIPHQLYAPDPPWPGFCWVDSGLGDRWKVWTGQDWERLGARPRGDRTVVEYPFGYGDFRLHGEA